jgi:hypothetical protein
VAPPASRAQPGSNRLLELLPRDEYALVLAELEEVALTSKKIVSRPGEPYAHVPNCSPGRRAVELESSMLKV